MFISWKKSAVVAGSVEQPEDGLASGAARLRSSLFAGSICIGCQPPGISAQVGEVGVAFTGAFSLELPFKSLLAFDSNYIKKIIRLCEKAVWTSICPLERL